jgi:hypothetical protein
MSSISIKRDLVAFLFSLLILSSASAQEGKSVTESKRAIERGSKFFVAPMEGGFDTYLVAAIVKKQVPVMVTTDRSKADYEITGISDSEKAGWAKMLFMGSEQSREQASVKVVHIQSGEVVYGYNVHKGNSYRGRQSAAEACAKHLKERIEGK